jgi:hypothetical protein
MDERCAILFAAAIRHALTQLISSVIQHRPTELISYKIRQRLTLLICLCVLAQPLWLLSARYSHRT